jgi:hypothetical protein
MDMIKPDGVTHYTAAKKVAAFEGTAGQQLRANISSWVCAAPTANEVPSGHKLRGIPNTAPSPQPNAALFLSLDDFKIFRMSLSVQAVRR